MKYVGSKNRISKYIAPIIQKYIDDYSISTYIEPFVGGANMIDKIKCNKKIGIDIHKYLIALLQQVQKDTSVFPDTLSEDEYQKVRLNKEKYLDWYVGLVGFCSYGGKWFGGYPRAFKKDKITPRDMPNEIIRNLIRQSPNLKNIDFICGDYTSIYPTNAVIYCDPPYKDTTKYATLNFNYDKFYDWCKEISKNNIVLISEYNMPSDFECIWQKDVTTSLKVKEHGDRIEKLFVLKNAKLN